VCFCSFPGMLLRKLFKCTEREAYRNGKFRSCIAQCRRKERRRLHFCERICEYRPSPCVVSKNYATLGEARRRR
jgi:hypothetical protein